MIGVLRRLYPRGPANRGVAVDAEGATLGPDWPLVRRTPLGFRCLSPIEARAIQAAVLGRLEDPDWLCEQCRRIAGSLAKGDTALAQIYGLRIPVGELDDVALRRLSALAKLHKAGFDPDEPRIPEGEPGAGQWTNGDEDSGTGEAGVGSGGAGGAGASGTGGGGDGGSLDGLSSDGASGAGDGAPPGAGGDNRPPIEYSIEIPAERPETAQERNSIVRRSAEWLRQAAGLGAVFAPEPRVRLFFAALEATAWVVEYLPEIRSYLDAPKSLEALQNAVDDSQPGYQTHHIVEGQYDSIDPDSNTRRFGRTRLDSRENLVRIPRWKHVAISSWYSTKNEGYDNQTPREWLRGKSWDDQYQELG